MCGIHSDLASPFVARLALGCDVVFFLFFSARWLFGMSDLLKFDPQIVSTNNMLNVDSIINVVNALSLLQKIFFSCCSHR